MTDQHAAALFALLLTCFTVYLCFRCIAWVVSHGWRSMLGPLALRGRAVVEWQDCDRKDGSDWDHEEVEALTTLVREATTSDADPAADEPDELAEHFRLWHAELSGEKQIARALRRMERWSQ